GIANATVVGSPVCVDPNTGQLGVCANNLSKNTAVGEKSLVNAIGSGNTAVGLHAGRNILAGSDNITIGTVGKPADNGIIRIGDNTLQGANFIAGISRTGVTSNTDEVTSDKLGVILSSARYKRDIQHTGNVSDGLLKLRPVSFTYKADRNNTPQYDLIAEDV